MPEEKEKEKEKAKEEQGRAQGGGQRGRQGGAQGKEGREEDTHYYHQGTGELSTQEGSQLEGRAIFANC